MKKLSLTFFALVVLFFNSFAQWNQSTGILSTTNAVGIGTTSPGAALDVGKLLNSGDLGTVLARLSEGNNAGVGTYLAVKGYGTQPTNVISFAIEHSFYGVTNSSINFFRGAGTGDGFLTFNTGNNVEAMRILGNGQMAIGTNDPKSYKLNVSGTLRANSITVNTTGADFVFEPDYRLSSLDKVNTFIKANHHLPDVSSAKQMQADGVDVGEMNKLLLQKVEELTLYLINENKNNKRQQQQIDMLKREVKGLKKPIKKQ